MKDVQMSHIDTQGFPAPLEDHPASGEEPSAVAKKAPPGVALYFPHVDKGQSVLVRFPGNQWFVIDSNHAAGGRPNGTVQILRALGEEPGFKIIAVVVTHFHRDHYSGISDIFAFCRELAAQRSRPLSEIVETLILPRSYEAFYKYVKDAAKPYLSGVLEELERLPRDEVDIVSLERYQFAWRSPEAGDLLPDESWMFTFYPPANTVNRWLLEGWAPNVNLPPPVKLGSDLQEDENQHAYILGVGQGAESSDLHVLLTSDIPGDEFSTLTRDLRDTILPRVRKGKCGASFDLSLLIRPASAEGGTRTYLRPVQCLTVPHHGSGNGPARAEDLDWWLDERRGEPGRPAFAMVQGGPDALKWNTLEELFTARLEVFATVKPRSILKFPRGHIGCKPLDDRMAAAAGPAAEARPSPRAEEQDFSPFPAAHLEVHGGVGGIHRVMAENLYKIVPNAPHWEHYASEMIYPRPAERFP
jgi:hypothetical protein